MNENRKIKFKFWDNIGKVMLCEPLADYTFYLAMIRNENNGYKDYVPLQSIEQSDKHGSDIYSGDIISSISESNPRGNVWVIEYRFGTPLMTYLRGGYKPDNDFILAYDFSIDAYEIIGNKFSNPELI